MFLVEELGAWLVELSSLDEVEISKLESSEEARISVCAIVDV
jgi:hypothetical protein